MRNFRSLLMCGDKLKDILILGMNYTELFSFQNESTFTQNKPDAATENISLWFTHAVSQCMNKDLLFEDCDEQFLCCRLQVHQGVIEDCGSKAGISLFLQVTMCLSNITCCLDAVCYYFIAHEVRSSKKNFSLSKMSQRKTTCSTSEVWTILQRQFEHILCSEGCQIFEQSTGNAQRADAGFRMRPLWNVRAGEEAGQRQILMDCRIKIWSTAGSFGPIKEDSWHVQNSFSPRKKVKKICAFQTCVIMRKLNRGISYEVKSDIIFEMFFLRY